LVVKGICYPWRWQIAGGWLEELSPMRLLLAMEEEEARVFWLEEREAESTVAEGGLLPMPGQRLLFMGQIREVNRVKRRKMKCRI